MKEANKCAGGISSSISSSNYIHFHCKYSLFCISLPLSHTFLLLCSSISSIHLLHGFVFLLFLAARFAYLSVSLIHFHLRLCWEDHWFEGSIQVRYHKWKLCLQPEFRHFPVSLIHLQLLRVTARRESNVCHKEKSVSMWKLSGVKDGANKTCGRTDRKQKFTNTRIACWICLHSKQTNRQVIEWVNFTAPKRQKSSAKL